MYYSENIDRLAALELGELFDTIISYDALRCGRAFTALGGAGIALPECGYITALIETPEAFTFGVSSHDALIPALTKRIPNGADCHVFSSRGKLFALFSLRDMTEDTGCSDIADAIRAAMRSFAGSPEAASAGAGVIISTPRFGRDAISHNAFEAENRADFHEFMDSPPRFTAMDFSPGALTGFGRNLDSYQILCNRLVSLVKNDDFSPEDAAKEMLSALIETCAKNYVPVHAHIHMLALTLTATVTLTGIADAASAKELVANTIHQSSGSETVLRGSATEFFTELRRLYLVNSRNLVAERMKLTARFVDENITKYDISVTSVADYFGVNRSLLTSQFKRHYGVSLSEFIQNARVKKAGELMSANRDWSMDRVAREAGYSSLSTMYRSFKKYNGATPASFK